MTDQQLIALVLAGEPRAEREFYDRHVDKVSDGDHALREKALFALSQHSNAAAGAALRAFAENEKQPVSLRERAIFSLGQRRDGEQTEYLRSLYRRIDEPQLREKILFAISSVAVRATKPSCSAS